MPIIQTKKKLKDRDNWDYYPTPFGLVQRVYELCFDNPENINLTNLWTKFLRFRDPYFGNFKVLDPGAGRGVWGERLKQWYPQLELTAVEIDKERQAINPYYDNWVWGNFLSTKFIGELQHEYGQFDLVIGNPPYTLPGYRKAAEGFVRNAMDLLKPGGILLFLLRQNFLMGQNRFNGLYKEYPLNYFMPTSRRPSFSGDFGTNAEDYAVFVWFKAHEGEENLPSFSDQTFYQFYWDYEVGKDDWAIRRKEILS